jgi:hypothetical protein
MPQQEIPDHWRESWDLTSLMFDKAGVSYDFI